MHLVTGATGHVGRHLAGHLDAAGHTLRVLVRDPAGLPDAAWVQRADVVVGSVADPEVLAEALEGVDVAYYLVHAMTDGHDYADVDRALATGFADACTEAGVERIVYLGGLWPDDVPLTEHLASRREVGDILLASGVPTAVLQAGIVLGPGSASHELLAFAVEWLPVVVGPTWLGNLVQPIALADLLVHLEAAGRLPSDVNRAFDVGGTEAVTYKELLSEFARATGRRPRPVVTFPVLLPQTTSLVAGMLSPGVTSVGGHGDAGGRLRGAPAAGLRADGPGVRAARSCGGLTGAYRLTKMCIAASASISADSPWRASTTPSCPRVASTSLPGRAPTRRSTDITWVSFWISSAMRRTTRRVGSSPAGTARGRGWTPCRNGSSAVSSPSSARPGMGLP